MTHAAVDSRKWTQIFFGAKYSHYLCLERSDRRQGLKVNIG